MRLIRHGLQFELLFDDRSRRVPRIDVTDGSVHIGCLTIRRNIAASLFSAIEQDGIRVVQTGSAATNHYDSVSSPSRVRGPWRIELRASRFELVFADRSRHVPRIEVREDSVHVGHITINRNVFAHLKSALDEVGIVQKGCAWNNRQEPARHVECQSTESRVLWRLDQSG